MALSYGSSAAKTTPKSSSSNNTNSKFVTTKVQVLDDVTVT